jgi:membrane-anchored mycosin MYCP
MAPAATTANVASAGPRSEGSWPPNAVLAAPKDLPALDIQLADQAPEWASSDSLLVNVVREAKGRAFVGFKNSASARTHSAPRLVAAEIPQRVADRFAGPRMVHRGTRAAISAQSIADGLMVVQARGGRIVKFYENLGLAYIELPADSAPVLRREGLIDWMEPDPMPARTFAGGRRTAAKEIPRFFTVFAPSWGVEMIHSVNAWGITQGSGARLLLIDTGIDVTHNNLFALPSPNCLGPYTGCVDESPGVHGTHVAGTMLAQFNSWNMVSIAPGVSPSDVYSWGACYWESSGGAGGGRFFAGGGGGTCPPETVTEAFNWAAAHLGPRGVINMSAGFSSANAFLATAVSAALNADIVVVAAVGNIPLGDPTFTPYPASLSGVIGVSGVRQDSGFAAPGYPTLCTTSGVQFGSNSGSFVSISAPYWATSTIPINSQAEWCGTSMSAPYVAGTALLVRAAHPTYTRLDVAAQIMGTAIPRSPATQYGAGIVQADLAVGFTPPVTTGTILTNKPRLSWGAVPMATGYRIYRRVTPTLAPEWVVWADVGSSVTSFTDTPTKVLSFVGYDVPPSPSSMWVAYQVVAVGVAGRESRAGSTVTYVPNGTPVY